MMELQWLGYFMALVIGTSLGLIGGGGSILAVPVLAYLFSLDETLATSYSLFIVGASSLVGGLRQSKNKNVNWKTALVFGFPAIVGVWLIRHLVLPALPVELFSVDGFVFTRRMMMFGVFSILMVWAAYSMLSNKERKGGTGEVNYNYPLIIVEGLVVGGITGFVGAGGGFLIIPALVVLANLEIKIAIGTSLIIIALKSLLGFFLSDALALDVDWSFLLIFTSIAIVGIFVGVSLGKVIDGRKLKKGFGYFIIAMAISIFFMEFIIR